MSRNYWLVVLVASALVTGGAGAYMFTALQEKALVEVPLLKKGAVRTPEQTAPAPVAPESSVGDGMAGASQPETPGSQPEPEGNASETADSLSATDSHKRNVLFTLYSTSAKEVFIIGDFNNWFREPLKKEEKNIWSITLRIDPGTYTYQYVVDEKKIADPNNKKVKDGKSVLIVNPAPSDTAKSS